MEKRTCYECLYAHWDPGRWLQNLSSGWPSASLPLCINHPDAPGELRPIPPAGPCRNFRPRPKAPAADPAQAPAPDAIRRIPLTRGKFALVDAADYEWLSKYRWSCRGGGNPYAARFEGNKVIWMHREIMQTPPGMVVDHIDGNGLNNLRFNMRNCTRQENVHNLSKAAHGSSIYKGVWKDRHRDKWYAKICHKGVRDHLGTFDDEVEAARAYDLAAVERHGPFARLNFPEEWPPERRRAVHAAYLARQNKPQSDK